MANDKMTTVRGHEGNYFRVETLTANFKNETVSGIPLKRKQLDRHSSIELQPFHDGTGRFSVELNIIDRYEKTTDHTRDTIILDKDQVAAIRKALEW